MLSQGWQRSNLWWHQGCWEQLAPELPEWLKAALMAHPAAWEGFQKLPPSHQRNYIGWISDAKREETRQKRIRYAIERLEKGLPLGLM